jgi:hypothetical protein
MRGRCPHRGQSAHVGASPPLPRSLGCGGGGTPPKGLWPPAEPPTPCVPRVCDCALFFSALHLASEAWRWRSVRAYSVLGSTYRRSICVYVLSCIFLFFILSMSCAGQRPVVRPGRWARAGEEGGQCPPGPWVLHQELGAAGGHSPPWCRHLVRAVVPPRFPFASSPHAL